MTVCDGTAALVRLGFRQRLRRGRQRVARAERVYRDAIADRDAVIVEAHGPAPWTPRRQTEGYLSYEEISKEVGISKGRVIQIIQSPDGGAAE